MANVVTWTGVAIETNLISGLGGTVPKYLGIGTGAGTSARTDTTLFTENTANARGVGTFTRITTSQTNDTLQVVATITNASSTIAVTNAGFFDASSSGNLWVKGDFAVVNIATGDSIQVTVQDQFT